MIPTTRPTSCGLAPVRAVDPALDFLPSVLKNIQSASRVLECGLREDDSMESAFLQRLWLQRLRSSAFSILNTFHLLKLAGRLAEFAGNANAILSTVENAVDVGNCGSEFKCALWKKSYKEIYPKCHALCHLVNSDTTSSSLFSFPQLSVPGGLLDWVTEFYDKLQVAYPDLDPENTKPLEDEKHRWYPQEIFSSTCQIFHALSQCRRGTADCSVSVHPEVRLALSAHSNIRDGGEHSVDVLFYLDTEEPLWDEVRIHMNSLASPSTNRDKRLAKPAVKFLEGSGKSTSTAPQWRTKKPKRFPHFCKLLDPRKMDTNATHRINVTLDTDNDFWKHFPTPRLARRDDLTHSVSLASFLASGMQGMDNLAKLKLVVILGYSLLYLFDGPWLRARKATGWSREKIIFFQKDGKVILRPFLRSNFRDDASNSSDDDDDDDDDDSSFHEYPALVDFAITLLELHLGETIESYLKIAEPLTSANQKWAFATDAFTMCQSFIGDNLRGVIEACLDPDFGDIKAGEGEHDDTEDENTDEHSGAEEANTEKIKQMHDRIFTKIVDPLQRHLDIAFSTYINPDNLDEESATLVLGSGHLAEKEESHYIVRRTNSTHEQKAMDLEKSSLKNGEAIVVTATTPVTSTEPCRAIFVPDASSRAEVGRIYSDFSGSLPVSLHDDALTDGWFAKFKSLEVLGPLQAIKPGDPRRVRMAIIDTGIDMSHIAMQAARACNRIVTVCDWVNGRGGVEDFEVGDASGHGTHLASLILKMAPHVDLYIARVTETHDLKDSQENIANAIRTASSTWGCSIISLSLGFTAGIPSIQHALDDAIKMNGVLVFAAASNDGANSGTAYPATLSNVFCIYSTDSYGNPSPFNPSPKALNGDAFGIIGENVLGAWPSSPASGAAGDSLQRMSGSSIATPIAAALVACVLGLASKWETENVIKLASYEGVRRVLFKMAVKRKEHLYLDPVSFFSRKESTILADLREVLDLKN